MTSEEALKELIAQGGQVTTPLAGSNVPTEMNILITDNNYKKIASIFGMSDLSSASAQAAIEYLRRRYHATEIEAGHLNFNLISFRMIFATRCK